jgi:hypothetical protein
MKYELHYSEKVVNSVGGWNESSNVSTLFPVIPGHTN